MWNAFFHLFVFFFLLQLAPTPAAAAPQAPAGGIGDLFSLTGSMPGAGLVAPKQVG